MKFLGFYLLIICFANVSWARMRPFQTARLHSSGGAGLASILLPESAILNPSTLTYFSESHFSYHQNTPKFKNKNEDRNADNLSLPKSTRHTGYFVYDNSGTTKGGAAYLQQRENNVYRERSIATMALPIGTNMAIGFNYRYTMDKLTTEERPRHQNRHQGVIGVTYIYTPELIFAAVVEDPFLAIKEENQASVGFQYAVTKDLMVIADYGANYSSKPSKNNLWRGAVQYNIFSDFFVRAGRFYDRIYDLEGIGWGISWVTPKFVAEFGTKTSNNLSKNVSYLYPDEKIIDTSFSIGLRF